MLDPGLAAAYNYRGIAHYNRGYNDLALEDFSLENLGNLEQVDLARLFELGAADAAELINKGQVLDRLLSMSAVPLRGLAHWRLIDADDIKVASRTLSVAELVALGVIDEHELDGSGIVTGGTVQLAQLLAFSRARVDLERLIKFGALGVEDLAAGATIDFDDLVASRLVNTPDLAQYGV